MDIALRPQGALRVQGDYRAIGDDGDTSSSSASRSASRSASAAGDRWHGLILGAGISGPCRNDRARRAGFQVDVFRHDRHAARLGFGVALAPSAIAALRELGVAETVVARGFEPRNAELRRMDGTVVKRAELPKGARRPDDDRAAAGAPRCVARRGRPRDHFARQPGRELLDGWRHVALWLTVLRPSDLLIGADGVGSVVRQLSCTLGTTSETKRDHGSASGVVHGALHPR